MSKLKHILIRADSSSEIGTGHIMRDLVLAKEFPEANIVFATKTLRGNINNTILEAGYKVVNLKTNDINELSKLLKKKNIEMLIIDHYDIDFTFEKELKSRHRDLKIMVLDDTYEKHACDILLNHNINADKKKYNTLVPKNCQLRCGAAYTLLREEFYTEKSKGKVANNSSRFKIFVAMGGADSANINISILKVLKKLPNIDVHILSTSANKNLEKLQKYAHNKEWIHLHVNSDKVAHIMNSCDMAIVTPSVTLNEIFFMQIPFIAIKTAQNQKELYNYIKERRYFALKKFDKHILRKKILSLKKYIKESHTLYLHNFIDLNLEQKEMILSWRNNPNIKKWMYQDEDIPLKEHLNFIDTLKNRRDRLDFLVEQNQKKIGVINFTNITKKSLEIGIYANPKLKGVGSVLLKSIINYAFLILKVKKLYAEVFQENERALNLYNNSGFIKIGKKIIRNKEVICLELKDENR